MTYEYVAEDVTYWARREYEELWSVLTDPKPNLFKAPPSWDLSLLLYCAQGVVDEVRESGVVGALRRVVCRLYGHHPHGVVWYNCGGLEPDMSCNNCGEDLG